MDSPPFFSIIVPVYNTSNFVAKCLNSIKTQNFENFEVIVINDGSSDNSQDIIKNEIEGLNNFIYFFQKNKGVSAARNLGLENSKGKYIYFLDSDDWLEPFALEKIHFSLNNNQSDILMFNFFKSTSSVSTPVFLFRNSGYLEGNYLDEFYQNMIGPLNSQLKTPLLLNQHVVLWNKVYKREIIFKNNIKFNEELGNGEDFIFNIDFFPYAKSATLINENLIHYRKDNISSITSKYNPKALGNIQKKHENLKSKILSENNFSMQQAYDNRVVLSCLNLFLNLTVLNSGLSFKEVSSNFHLIFQNHEISNALKNFESKDLTLFWRIYFMIIKFQNHRSIYIFNKLLNLVRRK